MFSGKLHGKVPPVLGDKLIITTIAVPGNGSAGEVIKNLLPPGVLDNDYVVAGARLVSGVAVRYGSEANSLPRQVEADIPYNPPVSDWISDTYIRAADAGATSCVVELFLSRIHTTQL